MGDFDVEIGDIRQTVKWMQAEGGAIETATRLQETMSALNGYAVPSDWSTVPSCTAFGASYNAAIEAYKSVADDLLADAQKMAEQLTAIADEYEKADASSRAAFDAAIKRFAEAGYLTQSPADQTYADHRSDLHSDHAEQATAQAPATVTGNGASPAPPTATTTAGNRTGIG